MKTASLWQISVETTPEAEDAVVALLERLFGQKASVYITEETKDTIVTVYSPKHAQRSGAKKEALLAGLKFLQDCGLNIGLGKISIAQAPPEDWAESWKKYFKTLEIGSALLIKPSWSDQRPKEGQACIVLDPGLSFGTGQHPTTAFCLEQIARCRKMGQSQSFLDIGTGSGILAIAAAKLGYETVHAFDFDPQAVKVARANARRNRVQHKMLIQRKDLTRLSVNPGPKYHLICANLVDDLLIRESATILGWLDPAGTLVLAGVLESQWVAVEKVYSEGGLVLVASRLEREWQSGALAYPAKPEGEPDKRGGADSGEG